jgi:Leucine-rich repeat (LRR) protein
MERIPENTLARSLQWLTLTNNALTSLPADIGQLAHLRKLLLTDNRLRTLPCSIVLCESLELVRKKASIVATVLHSIPVLH